MNVIRFVSKKQAIKKRISKSDKNDRVIPIIKLASRKLATSVTFFKISTSISVFLVSVAQSLVSSATINIFL